ncbi:SpaA isopeptide-forming pilin-related protein [Frisingicoccus sp.]|uniref:SpaA isopeptide-forming pilin-related protein n=1 Tax=Frisingicoccus sp. TaxID=1918627 RepID=UPI003AB4EB35
MRPWKRVLAMVCVMALTAEISLNNSVAVYAEEYNKVNDTTEEVAQREAESLDDGNAVGLSEETVVQQPETLGEETAQTESEATKATEVKETISETEIPESALETQPETSEKETAEKETADKDKEKQEVTNIELKTNIDGVEITMAGLSTSFPQGKKLSISAKHIDSATKAVVEEALEAEAEQNDFKVKDYLAYDITLLADGREVQPEGPVEVIFSGTEFTRDADVKDEDIAVYHVADQTAAVSDMNGEVASNGDVIMETTHFSTYVIVKKVPQEVKVTIQHYLWKDGKGSKLYTDKEYVLNTIKDGDEVTLSDYTREDSGYKIFKVVQVKDSEKDNESEEAISEQQLANYEVTGDTTIRVYYEEQEAGTVQDGVTFFDYTVGTLDINATYGISDADRTTKIQQAANGGINAESNYPAGSGKNQRLAMGQSPLWPQNEKDEAVGLELHEYETYKGTVDNNENPVIVKTPDGKTYSSFDINKDNSSSGEIKGAPIITGIIKNLTGSAYSEVNFADGIAEPGFFTRENKIGKTIYDDFTLEFKQSGNSYELQSVKNGSDTVANAGVNFWPLDNVSSAKQNWICKADDPSGAAHNWFFGMRYDFKFKLGDYVNDLYFEFTGDDDMWVFMDGELILDLGGIHTSYPNKNLEYKDKWRNDVNLWSYLNGETSYNADAAYDPSKADSPMYTEEHTITVLYMERGGYGSNCHMKFAVPSLEVVEPVISTTPKTSLTFSKVDSEDPTRKLEGTEFTLYRQYQNGELSDEITKAVSDKNGEVTFNNLRQGTYYLQETKSTDGYYRTRAVFTVEVIDEGGTLKAYLKKSSGATITYIENHKLENMVTTSKTAEVLDYDKRTYEVNLQASVHSFIDQYSEPVDIVLITDVSASMLFPGNLQSTGKTITLNDWKLNQLGGNGPYYVISDPEGTATVYRLEKSGANWYYTDASLANRGNDLVGNLPEGKQIRSGDKADGWGNYKYTIYTDPDSTRNRLYYLKNSVNDFIEQLGEYSPESRIGLVTFCASATTHFNGQLLELSSSNIGRITNTISNISTATGTRQDLALNQAKTLLENNRSERKKIVILITDGAPNPYSNEVLNAIETNAQTIKNSGATLMTVGLSLDQVVKAKNLLRGISSKDENNQPYFYDAKNGASLESTLQTILETISEVPLVTGVFRDYINDSFYLIDQNGNKLDVGAKAYGGTVGKDSNGYYIEWPSEPIVEDPGNIHTIHVRAKDDFIGGNVIETNKPGSGLTTEDGHIEFDEPSVNVKLLDLTSVNKEMTVFLGDDVTTPELIKELADEAPEIIEIATTPDGENIRAALPKDCRLDADDIASLINKESVTKEYSYSGSNGAVGTFTYTVKQVTQAGDLEKHPAEKEGEKVEQYVLEVVYTPKTIADRGLGDPKSEKPGDEVKNSIKKENNYYVNVIAGSLEIIKKIETSSDSDQKFKFEVTKEGDANFKKEIEITVDAGQTEGRLTEEQKEQLNHLSRGTYKVTEKDSNVKYELDRITEAEENQCNVVSGGDDKSISFVVGTDKNNKDSLDTVDNSKTNLSDKYPNGRLAVAEVINKAATYKLNIHKVSASDGTSPLSGAEFKLKKNGSNEERTVTTDKNGNAAFENLPEGTYELVETKAPTGFALSTEKYTVTFPYEVPEKADGRITVGKTKADEAGKTIAYEITITVENEVLYELPSGGGRGIYWYSIGGMLIMMAAALILYKNKHREVLER